MRSVSAAERGSVTAEFAVVVPAVILVLASCLVALQLVGVQLRLQDAAAAAARTVARGDGLGLAADRASRLVAGARLAQANRGDLVCVSASVSPGAAGSPVGAGLIAGLTLTASSCALGGGQ